MTHSYRVYIEGSTELSGSWLASARQRKRSIVTAETLPSGNDLLQPLLCEKSVNKPLYSSLDHNESNAGDNITCADHLGGWMCSYTGWETLKLQRFKRSFSIVAVVPITGRENEVIKQDKSKKKKMDLLKTPPFVSKYFLNIKLVYLSASK